MSLELLTELPHVAHWLQASAAITWDVDPIIGKVGPLTFRYYGILFALGLLAAHHILIKQFMDENDDPEEAIRLTYWLLLGTVLGSRLGHVFFYEPARYLENPVEIIKFWKGGLASHGGTIGVVVVCIAYALWRKLPIRVIIDRLAIAAPMTMVTVRLGNLFNSEVYGRPTNVDWAFIFTRIDNVPRHPSQLYEALTGLVLAITVLLWDRYYKKGKKERPLGLMMSFVLAAYFTARFSVEYVKDFQTLDPMDSSLTMGQYLSIVPAAIGYLGLWASLAGPWRHQHASQFMPKPKLKEEPDEDASDEDASAS